MMPCSHYSANGRACVRLPAVGSVGRQADSLGAPQFIPACRHRTPGTPLLTAHERSDSIA